MTSSPWPTQPGSGDFDVVGHDWGGMVAWSLAARHPDRVRTATVLVSPHPHAFRHALGHSAQGLRSWYMALFQLPWLPERLFAFKRGKEAERLFAAPASTPPRPAATPAASPPPGL